MHILHSPYVQNYTKKVLSSRAEYNGIEGFLQIESFESVLKKSKVCISSLLKYLGFKNTSERDTSTAVGMTKLKIFLKSYPL